MKTLIEIVIIVAILSIALASLKMAYGQENNSTDIQLLSQKLKKGDRFGLTHFIGQVKNVGNNTIDNVEIGLTGYDKNGDVIYTKSAITEPVIINRNQKATFDTPAYTEDYKDVESYQLSIKWNSNGTEHYMENATSLIQR
jgi:preprotein translocase subunit YajC